VLSVAQTPVSRARLIAVAAPSSGAFLQAIPMSSVGTRLYNTSMRIAVSLRLGARDTAINSIVKTSLLSAEMPSRLEPRGLARDDGKRPDGVTSMTWKNGRCLICDVTCPDTLAASYLDTAVTGLGVVAIGADLIL